MVAWKADGKVRHENHNRMAELCPLHPHHSKVDVLIPLPQNVTAFKERIFGEVIKVKGSH